MTQITATERPILWAVRLAGEVALTGETPVGAVTVTSHDIVSAADENEFLGALVGQAGDYDPLPAYGQPCEGGAIYGYNGSLVICRKSHNRTEHAPETVPALFAVYRADAGEALEWVAGEGVLVGTRRLYGGVLYECLQAHQTQVDWTPPSVPALWAEVGGGQPGAWAAGVAYAVGTVVTYNDISYTCLQAHTSQVGWEPPNVPALWEAEGGEPEPPPPGDWATGVAYQVGDLVTYNGHTYSCRQAHTSIATWTPTAVPALWLLVE